MFGRGKIKRRSMAEDAWDAMVSRWESARGHTGDLVGDRPDRVERASGEAKRRAGAALDALAGRRPPKPWSLLMAAMAAGVVVGWIAASAVGRMAGQPPFDRGTDAAPLDATTG